MPTQIIVPALGESVVEATVARWLKQEGQRVSVGETLVELETDKVNLDVGAERAGVLARIERKEGEDVKVGDVLGVIEESAEKMEGAPTPPTETIAKEAPATAKPREEPTREVGEEKSKVTPLAKRLAQEHGVDLSQVPASSADGRVTKQDVQSFLEKQKAEKPAAEPVKAKVTAPAPAPPAEKKEVVTTERKAAPSAPALAPERMVREERMRMSRRRRTIATRLVEAQHTAAMLTTFNEIDMTAVMEIRKRRKNSFMEGHGVSLGIMSFFVRGTIGALKAFPQLNAEIQEDEIVLKHYYDIGIAVGATEGLVVPVLRDADRMSFAEIEKAIKDFVRKAEDNTLSLDELRGGTFTITNGGVFGSLLSTPILNPPQVGILGLHKIEERPIALNGEIVIRPMMYVALSYDHRIVDGREAVQFLVRVKKLLEDPESLLLEG